jgi:hypothetical protein
MAGAIYVPVLHHDADPPVNWRAFNAHGSVMAAIARRVASLTPTPGVKNERGAACLHEHCHHA